MEREVGNFYLTESCYPPGMNIPKHSHQNASVYFVLNGSMAERCGNVTREREPSNLVFTPPEEPHSNRIRTTGCRLFMIEMKARWLASIKEHSCLPESTSHFNSALVASLGRRAYHEVRRPDSFSPLVIEGLILELLAEISRQQKRGEQKEVPWLKRARDILQDRFATKLTVKEVAGELDIHPVYFASAFRRHYGCTVGEYIRHARIEYACSQLRCSRASLTDVALAAGFFDQSHFSRTFKLLVGMTPAGYRAMNTRVMARPRRGQIQYPVAPPPDHGNKTFPQTLKGSN
jgi:AraC family transcriptional regulator